MYRNLQFIFILALSLLLSSNIYAKKDDYPQWVLQSLNDDTYYYGVGMAYKARRSTAHIVEAERQALQKLSENISFTLKTNSVMVQLSADQQTRDDLTAIIQVRASNDVQGYEKIEVFENSKEYWVLFRLSKSLYAENERKKHEAAVAKARANIERATHNESSNDIGGAIVQYAQALDNLKAYFNSDNKALVDGTLVDIVPYSYNKLKEIISSIALHSPSPAYSVMQGSELDSIVCSVAYKNSPIYNVFLKANFLDTKISNRSATSNTAGLAYFKSPKLSTEYTNTTLEFSLDLASLFEINNVDYVIRRWIGQLYTNKAQTIIHVLKANVYVDTQSFNHDRRLSTDIIRTPFVKALTALSYNCVSSPQEANFVIRIHTNTVHDYTLDNIRYAHLTMNIEVIDSKGTVILSETMPRSRGVGVSIEGAGLNAYYQSIPLVDKRYTEIIQSAINY